MAQPTSPLALGQIEAADRDSQISELPQGEQAEGQKQIPAQLEAQADRDEQRHARQQDEADGGHAECGVLEEAAPFPPEDEMQRRGEQYNVSERDQLRERQPGVEAFTSGLARQLLPLRRHLSPKQPVWIDLLGVVPSAELRHTKAGAMFVVTCPRFQVTTRADDDDISA